MSEQASATFKVDSWDEQTSVEATDGAGKVSRAVVDQTLAGGIEGSGRAEWLMCYRPDETADFVGLQRIDGSLDGRRGTVVMTSNGSFDGSRVEGSVRVVEGSGTGELAGIRGDGSFTAPLGSEASVQLDYELG